MSVKLGLPDISTRLFCAIDADGQRHFLIRLNSSDSDLNDKSSRGLSVATKNLIICQNPLERFIDIICLDSVGYSIFDIIGGELANELAKDKTRPSIIVDNVLSKWRRFWGHIPSDSLSREEIIGLFAELWFLSYWMIPNIGIAESIKRWRGPFGSRHDFESIGLSIEVKSTTTTRGRIFKIHGLNQLELPENGKLFLFCMRVHEEAGAKNTLVSIIDTCRFKIMENEEAMNMFDTALIEAGYSPAHNDIYEKIRLRIVEENLFIVGDDFPKILVNDLIPSVLKGIENVEYSINLNGYDHLIMAKSAIEADMIK